jgi:RiboL-PSP-HEPN
MSVARSAFYETIRVMRSLAQNPLLTDLTVSASEHNIRARILRNGLIISSFALMESYLEDRLDEKIRELSNSAISYSSFNEPLRSFLTVEAIKGLATRIGFSDRSDQLQLAERLLVDAAGFRAAPPNYTGLGFSPKGSNISENDIKNLFSAFGVTDSWRLLSNLCAKLGSARVSLRDDFKNFLRARNKSAHDSTTNVPTADVETHLATALLIGITSDIVVTNTIDCFVVKRTTAAAELAANSIATLSIRFFDEQGGGAWAERVDINGRVIKRYSDRAAGMTEVRSRSRPLPIVVRNTSLVPMELV